MTTIRELANYVEELLESKSTPDYPGALNGLQLENQSEIKAVAAAVDFLAGCHKGGNSEQCHPAAGYHWNVLGYSEPVPRSLIRQIKTPEAARYSLLFA